MPCDDVHGVQPARAGFCGSGVRKAFGGSHSSSVGLSGGGGGIAAPSRPELLKSLRVDSVPPGQVLPRHGPVASVGASVSARRPPTRAARRPRPLSRGGVCRGEARARPISGGSTARERRGLSRRPGWPVRRPRRPGRDACIPNAEWPLGLRAAPACIRSKTSRRGAPQTWSHCAVPAACRVSRSIAEAVSR